MTHTSGRDLRKAVRYANDFMVPAGYLAVFNLTEELLVFEGDGQARWPPTVRVGNTTTVFSSSPCSSIQMSQPQAKTASSHDT